MLPGAWLPLLPSVPTPAAMLGLVSVSAPPSVVWSPQNIDGMPPAHIRDIGGAEPVPLKPYLCTKCHKRFVTKSKSAACVIPSSAYITERFLCREDIRPSDFIMHVYFPQLLVCGQT